MPIDFRSLKVRTLFISDVHLGFRFAKAAACLEVLRAVSPRQIYLIGDTVDGWRLVQSWYWPDSHNDVIMQLIAMQNSGVDICLCPGNHDDCFRDQNFTGGNPADRQKQLYQVASPILNLRRSESFLHETADGKRLLVTHGDQYDDVAERTAGVSTVGRQIFSRFSWLLPESGYHRIRRFFKRMLARPDEIQQSLVDEARSQQLDGIIFGHIHRPAMHEDDGFIIANTGDWVENESLLLELDDGTLIMINFGQTIARLQ